MGGAQPVGVIRHSNLLLGTSKHKTLRKKKWPKLNFPLLKNLKKFVKKAVVTITLVWILVAGEIANAASGSGGRMGGSFKSSSTSTSPYRPSTSFPTSGQIRRHSATRLSAAPNVYTRSSSRSSLSREGSSTVVVGAKSYVIPIALYGSFLYVNSKKRRNREGVGVSVLKLSLAFDVVDRDAPGNILLKLKEISSSVETDSREEVQKMVSAVCLELMRQQSNIFAASSSYERYSKATDAEKSFNNLSIRERSKFEKETINNFGGISDTEDECDPGTMETDFTGSTSAIVTIILSIEGNETKPRSKMNAWQDIWDALSQIGANVMVKDCLLGAEVLWTPERRSDVVTRRDIAADYTDLRII